MAGDWIPMRTDLWDCPEVVRMLSAICPQSVRGASEAVRNESERVRKKSELIGALFRVWSLFDTYSDDGTMPGYDAGTLNSMVGIDGFAEQMQAVGWLKIHADSLEMPGFDRHLGASAKRRLKDAQRKRESRKNASAKRPQNVRTAADKKRTTEQNRTEQYLPPPSAREAIGFEDEWARWCAWHESIHGRPIDPIQAEAVLMDLARRGADKARTDIDFSIRKGAKSILDSDHDYSRPTNGRTRSKLTL